MPIGTCLARQEAQNKSPSELGQHPLNYQMCFDCPQGKEIRRKAGGIMEQEEKEKKRCSNCHRGGGLYINRSGLCSYCQASLVGIKDPEKKNEALAAAATRIGTPELFTRKRRRAEKVPAGESQESQKYQIPEIANLIIGPKPEMPNKDSDQDRSILSGIRMSFEIECPINPVKKRFLLQLLGSLPERCE